MLRSKRAAKTGAQQFFIVADAENDDYFNIGDLTEPVNPDQILMKCDIEGDELAEDDILERAMLVDIKDKSDSSDYDKPAAIRVRIKAVRALAADEPEQPGLVRNSGRVWSRRPPNNGGRNTQRNVIRQPLGQLKRGINPRSKSEVFFMFSKRIIVSFLQYRNIHGRQLVAT